MTSVFTSLNEIAESIPDGSKLALAPEYNGCGCALAVVRALVNRSPRDLHLIGVPALGLQADLLIGINAVSKVECAAVTLGEEGLAPRFSTSSMIWSRKTRQVGISTATLMRRESSVASSIVLLWRRSGKRCARLK